MAEWFWIVGGIQILSGVSDSSMATRFNKTPAHEPSSILMGFSEDIRESEMIPNKSDIKQLLDLLPLNILLLNLSLSNLFCSCRRISSIDALQ